MDHYWTTGLYQCLLPINTRVAVKMQSVKTFRCDFCVQYVDGGWLQGKTGCPYLQFADPFTSLVLGRIFASWVGTTCPLSSIRTMVMISILAIQMTVVFIMFIFTAIISA
ncbi:hypothetical protein CHARACLAT_006325 [Characodon lateralis]|uniref:Uncharacterized protein n=1 Tax=Characodon lateralis TaxID=208331 RepID=A0ABU7DRZ2_9TELE|nr:hypothetical protein [Characodon lateralis]